MLCLGFCEMFRYMHFLYTNFPAVLRLKSGCLSISISFGRLPKGDGSWNLQLNSHKCLSSSSLFNQKVKLKRSYEDTVKMYSINLIWLCCEHVWYKWWARKCESCVTRTVYTWLWRFPSSSGCFFYVSDYRFLDTWCDVCILDDNQKQWHFKGMKGGFFSLITFSSF